MHAHNEKRRTIPVLINNQDQKCCDWCKRTVTILIMRLRHAYIQCIGKFLL